MSDAPTPAEEAARPLTPEQLENWRSVLLSIVGPYALAMPAEDVQRFRDMMQARVAALTESAGKEEG